MRIEKSVQSRTDKRSACNYHVVICTREVAEYVTFTSYSITKQEEEEGEEEDEEEEEGEEEEEEGEEEEKEQKEQEEEEEEEENQYTPLKRVLRC